MGLGQTDYFKFAYRDYNMGSGFSMKEDMQLCIKNRVTMSITAKYGCIYTWIGEGYVDGMGEIH